LESLTEEISGTFVLSQNEGSILIFLGLSILSGMLAGLFLSSATSIRRVFYLSNSQSFIENRRTSQSFSKLAAHPLQLRMVLQSWGILFTLFQAVSILPVYFYLVDFFNVGGFVQILIFLILLPTLIILEYGISLIIQYRYESLTIKFIAPFAILLWRIIKPLAVLYERAMKKSIQSFQNNQPITMSELSETIEMNDDENPAESKILRSIVEFGEVEVKEVMKSRGEVITVDIDLDFKQLIEVIVQCGYSRMPVIDQTFDQVVGILYIKDILPHLQESELFDWHFLIRKPYFTHESKLLSELLEAFRAEKNHIAVVVDEYGGTSGIITLEDILEEIVGDITDEMDEGEIDFSHPEPNRYLFEGKTLLNDFLRIVGEESDYYDDFRGEMESLAGLLLEKFREIPQKGKEIQIKDYIFRIKLADTRRIKQIEVIVNKKAL